jgi:basic membrane protein A
MDIPLIRKFQCGYEQGAKYANPKIEVFSNMTGTTGRPGTTRRAAANWPRRSSPRARRVFAAAGGTGIGVYQAAKDAGKLAIGVDSNQNHMQPGTMLTSMVKRVDVAVYNVLGEERQLEARRHRAGPEGRRRRLRDRRQQRQAGARRLKAKVDAAKADIIAGKIKVADYMADNACKY